jgi:hypothetical protein
MFIQQYNKSLIINLKYNLTPDKLSTGCDILSPISGIVNEKDKINRCTKGIQQSSGTCYYNSSLNSILLPRCLLKIIIEKLVNYIKQIKDTPIKINNNNYINYDVFTSKNINLKVSPIAYDKGIFSYTIESNQLDDVSKSVIMEVTKDTFYNISCYLLMKLIYLHLTDNNYYVNQYYISKPEPKLCPLGANNFIALVSTFTQTLNEKKYDDNITTYIGPEGGNTLHALKSILSILLSDDEYIYVTLIKEQSIKTYSQIEISKLKIVILSVLDDNVDIPDELEIENTKYILNSATAITTDYLVNHAIAYIVCDNEYYIVDSNKPTQIINYNWKKNGYYIEDYSSKMRINYIIYIRHDLPGITIENMSNAIEAIMPKKIAPSHMSENTLLPNTIKKSDTEYVTSFFGTTPYSIPPAPIAPFSIPQKQKPKKRITVRKSTNKVF